MLNTIDREIIEQNLERFGIGDQFTVPDLFGQVWEERTDSEKRTIGKSFRACVRAGEYDFLLFIEINYKDRAVYRRTR